MNKIIGFRKGFRQPPNWRRKEFRQNHAFRVSYAGQMWLATAALGSTQVHDGVGEETLPQARRSAGGVRVWLRAGPCLGGGHGAAGVSEAVARKRSVNSIATKLFVPRGAQWGAKSIQNTRIPIFVSLFLGKHAQQEAVSAWPAGIRFAGHLAKGGSLISALIAKSALLPNLQALTAEAKQGHLNGPQK
jgi:hypothetical protein